MACTWFGEVCSCFRKIIISTMFATPPQVQYMVSIFFTVEKVTSGVREMILTVSESVNKVSKVNQSSFRFLLKMHLRKSPKKFAAVKVGICKFSSKSFSEKTCSYPWQHVQIFSDAMLSFTYPCNCTCSTSRRLSSSCGAARRSWWRSPPSRHSSSSTLSTTSSLRR